MAYAPDHGCALLTPQNRILEALLVRRAPDERPSAHVATIDTHLHSWQAEAVKVKGLSDFEFVCEW